MLAGPIPDLRAKGVPDPVGAALEVALDTDPACRPGSAVAFGEILRSAGAQVGLTIADVPLELAPSPAQADGAADIGPEHRVDTAMLLDAAHPGELRRDNFGAEMISAAREVDHLGVGPGDRGLYALLEIVRGGHLT